jgi:tryptophan synthase alpha chain
LEGQVRLVRRLIKRRIVVGFGVSTPDQVGRIAKFADGVVVGSALVERIGEIGDHPQLAAEIEAVARRFAVATSRR